MVKTKVLISSMVTMQLICTFDFAYAKSRSSIDAAHIVLTEVYCLSVRANSPNICTLLDIFNLLLLLSLSLTLLSKLLIGVLLE